MDRAGDQSISQIRALPKIDLHRHILGAARAETLWRLAQKYGVAAGRLPLNTFRDLVAHSRPQRSLDLYIAPWSVFRDVVREPEDVERIACEAAEDARADGVLYVEFRSSLPGLPLTDGRAPQTQIAPDEYLDAIRRGFSRIRGVTCRLIASMVRHALEPTHRGVLQHHTNLFLDALSPYRSDLVVGVDLTGIERGWPAGLFTELFRAARCADLPVTIHAGETEGPEEIWVAIEQLGARRIGHGTSAAEDPALVRVLIERNIPLEVCPTAGWLTSRLPTTASHPIIANVPEVPYVICTDNPAVNFSSQSEELSIAAKIAGCDAVTFAMRQFDVARLAAFGPTRALAGKATRA